MKILHTVESYLPEVHGMSEVVRQLSENLVLLGHEVIVCTSFSVKREFDTWKGVKIRQFNICGNFVNGITGEINLYVKYLLEEKYDIITNFAAQQWATDLCLDILPNIKAKKIFVPTGFSGLSDLRYKNYFEKMKKWMSYYDMNVFLSENYRDIRFAKENDILKIKLIPNGASLSEFTEIHTFDIRKHLNIHPDEKIILHVGSYTSMKGHDEALNIFLASKTKKNHLVFVGENFKSIESINFQIRINWFRGLLYKNFYKPSSIRKFFQYLSRLKNEKMKSIHLISLSRKDLIATYQQADILLFPSVIECSPIVLFESMASKTPFLVTDVGNSAEIIKWSESGILLPTVIDEKGYSHAKIEDSASLLDKIINDEILLEKLSNKGYNKWISNYTWEKISILYESLYKQLIYSK